MTDPKVFIPGAARAADIPLSRFLPPLPAGVVSTWLADNLEPGAWLLDPYGASPHLAVEAARAGYRVAVAANNPIARFLIDILAQPPTADELRGAMAELAAARRNEERLEPHILGLYMSVCPECGAQTSAEAFIWEKEAPTPHKKLIHCESCGHKGEHETDEADCELAASYQRGGPHRARALERIAPSDSPDRQHAEEALEAYPPRAVYALFTIVNRLDSLRLEPGERRALEALLLNAFDRANNLWRHPSGRERPKQLGAPPVYREYNIWRELEASQALWAGEGEMVVLTEWPDAPPEIGGISLYEGRLREMVADLGPLPFQAVLTAFPRPNQAYWTLSALWAGWLWGREAIGPFTSVLRRRRYDWAWHTEALQASLARLGGQLESGTPMFGIVGESEPGFNAAVLLAARLADFHLEGLSMRREMGQLQANWRKGAAAGSESDAPDLVEAAAKQVLNSRGEPSHFSLLHAAAHAALARGLSLDTNKESGEQFSELRSQLEQGLTYRRGFLRYGGSDSSLETGHWWLRAEGEARSPLADRVEIALVRHLLRYPGRSLAEIDRALCAVFPGLLTPPRRLIEIGLASYGADAEGAWRLDAVDQPRARRDDLREMRALIADLGQRLGFEVSGRAPIEWRSPDGEVSQRFFVIASALVSEVLSSKAPEGATSLVALPGGRAQLALYKIERDPRLKQALDAGWRLVKFRHLRRLAGNQALTLESFLDLLDLDPLAEEQI